MNARSRHDHTSDFGPSDAAVPPRYTPGDGLRAYGDVTPFGYDDPMEQTAPMLLADFGPGFGPDAGHPDHQAEPGRATGRGTVGRTGRQPKARGKVTRKRAGQVVAAAAALAAGAAAFVVVSGGNPGPEQANASMALQGNVASRAVADRAVTGAGHWHGAAAAPVEVAKATAHVHSRAHARHAGASTRAAASPHRASATHQAVRPAGQASGNGHPAGASAAAPAVRSSASASKAPAPSASAKAAASSPATTLTSAKTVTCSGSGMLPQNVSAIVSFLLSHGYSKNAAAGIAGNIYQESKGNPESVGSGGGGLIGWTPLTPGLVTGNPTADLQTQLNAVLKFNNGWSQFLPALMSASSPAAAASIYVTDFERAGIPAAATRQASATAVASACGL